MKNWHEIEGQERPKDILARALAADRMHHAYLFAGPEGVGKFTTAHALAAILNCERRAAEDLVFCGECPACRKIAQEQHPDVHLVRPEGGVNKTIKIEQIRAIQKAAIMRPYEARYRVVVFDDAHEMTDQAANALLKTLEEPPDTMRLVLVTDQPNRLLITILSRCQLIRFGALEQEQVVKLLAEALEEDEDAEPVDRELLGVAAGFGEGSVGRALRVLESGLLSERKTLIEDVAALRSDHPMDMLDLAEKLSKDRGSLAERLDVLKVLLRDVMILEATDNPERVVNRDILDSVRSFGEGRSMDDLLADIDEVREAQQRLARYVNAQMVTEHLLDRLQRSAP